MPRRRVRPWTEIARAATVAVLLVALYSVALTEMASAASTVVGPELFPARDGSLLRRVLFGGEPFVTICREKKEDAEQRAESFAETLRVALGRKSHVRVLRAPCGEKFGSSGNTLQKLAKLKREAQGLPVLMWTAHGRPAKQIPAKSFTSAVQGSSSKDGARQLDANKLARLLERSDKGKATTIKSNSALAKECLDLKYQVCAVILKHGGTERLASSKLSLLLGVARKHRFLRVATVDTKEFALALGSGTGVGLADESLVLLRRNEFVYSGPPELGPPKNEAAEAAREQEKAMEMESLRAPHKVADTDRFPSGVALSLGLGEIGKATTAAQRMVAFRKHAIQSRTAARGLDPHEKQAKLAFLFHNEHDAQGYILDWPAARPLLVDRLAFGDMPDADMAATLGPLQVESLSRAKRGGPVAAASAARGKPKRSKKSKGTFVAVHPPKLLKDSEALVDAVRSFVRDPQSGTFAPYKDRPSLSKIIASASRSKKSSSSSSSSSFKRASSSSSSPKSSGTARAASDREWERRRRQEMEEEARASGAYAMPSGLEDGEDENDDAMVGDDNDDEDDEEDNFSPFADENEDEDDEDEDDEDEVGGEEIFLSDHDEHDEL